MKSFLYLHLKSCSILFLQDILFSTKLIFDRGDRNLIFLLLMRSATQVKPPSPSPQSKNCHKLIHIPKICYWLSWYDDYNLNPVKVADWLGRQLWSGCSLRTLQSTFFNQKSPKTALKGSLHYRAFSYFGMPK